PCGSLEYGGKSTMVNFMVLPPEINSLLMFNGAGSAPMLEAAAAWEGLASELGSAASSFSSVTSGLTGHAWQGAAAQALAAGGHPIRRVVEFGGRSGRRRGRAGARRSQCV